MQPYEKERATSVSAPPTELPQTQFKLRHRQHLEAKDSLPEASHVFLCIVTAFFLYEQSIILLFTSFQTG